VPRKLKVFNDVDDSTVNNAQSKQIINNRQSDPKDTRWERVNHLIEMMKAAGFKDLATDLECVKWYHLHNIPADDDRIAEIERDFKERWKKAYNLRKEAKDFLENS